MGHFQAWAAGCAHGGSRSSRGCQRSVASTHGAGAVGAPGAAARAEEAILSGLGCTGETRGEPAAPAASPFRHEMGCARRTDRLPLNQKSSARDWPFAAEACAGGSLTGRTGKNGRHALADALAACAGWAGYSPEFTLVARRAEILSAIHPRGLGDQAPAAIACALTTQVHTHRIPRTADRSRWARSLRHEAPLCRCSCRSFARRGILRRADPCAAPAGRRFTASATHAARPGLVAQTRWVMRERLARSISAAGQALSKLSSWTRALPRSVIRWRSMISPEWFFLRILTVQACDWR